MAAPATIRGGLNEGDFCETCHAAMAANEAQEQQAAAEIIRGNLIDNALEGITSLAELRLFEPIARDAGIWEQLENCPDTMTGGYHPTTIARMAGELVSQVQNACRDQLFAYGDHLTANWGAWNELMATLDEPESPAPANSTPKKLPCGCNRADAEEGMGHYDDCPTRRDPDTCETCGATVAHYHAGLCDGCYKTDESECRCDSHALFNFGHQKGCAFA